MNTATTQQQGRQRREIYKRNPINLKFGESSDTKEGKNSINFNNIKGSKSF